MKKAVFQLEKQTCPSCIKKIEQALHDEHGVKEATVFFNSSKVRAAYNENVVDAHKLEKRITALGFPVLSTKTSE